MSTDLRVTIGVLIFLMAAMIIALVWHVVRSRTRGRREAGVSIKDLRGLESKQMLTDQEIKAVRRAIAKQYLEEEKERQQQTAPDTTGMSPLELLAWEAQQVEIRSAAKQAGIVRQPPPPELEEALGESPPQRLLPPAQPPEVIQTPSLPEHLRPMVSKSNEEIEDLLQAGFLTDDDYALLRAYREQAG